MIAGFRKPHPGTLIALYIENPAGTEMVLDTSLPEELQTEFEQKLRDVLAGVTESEHGVERRIPDPRRTGDLDLRLAPELTSITVKGFDDRLVVVALEFYLPVAPEVDLRPNDTYLRELDGGYQALAGSLLETLARYCDAGDVSTGMDEATSEDGATHETAEPADHSEGFVCTEVFAGDTAKFACCIEYPTHVGRIYREGLWEEAWRFGLPT